MKSKQNPKANKKRVLLTATDPEGRIIHLHDSTWAHIKKHPEITKAQEIKAIIQKPDFITEVSARTSLIHTKISSSSLYANTYSKMTDTYKEGRVKTAFLTGKPPRGDVIWYRKT